jgi:F-type H+-transporting ATPase subunit gamma
VKREQALRRQLASLRMLGSAVTAMKSLSAHHLRAARDGLAAARDYRDGLDALVASIDVPALPHAAAPPGVLLVAADLGLCGGYNVRLAEAAIDQYHHAGASRLYCVGRRPLAALRRSGIETAATWPAVTSVAGITGLLLTLADDVLGDYLTGAVGAVDVVSARFDGIGAFAPVTTRVLPFAPKPAAHAASTRYSSADRLVRVAMREYLYATLYGLMLDALASEHGMRLVSTQSAGQWLDRRVDDVHRRLSSVRREAGTQEVLEVAAGGRQRRRAAARV